MHSMNGFLYGNLMGLDMTEGDRVRWHVAAYGGEVGGKICALGIHDDCAPVLLPHCYGLKYVFAR